MATPTWRFALISAIGRDGLLAAFRLCPSEQEEENSKGAPEVPLLLADGASP